jgi:hypothetical protein
VFRKDDSITGNVTLTLPAGKKMEHQGIKLELLGSIGKFLVPVILFVAPFSIPLIIRNICGAQQPSRIRLLYS